ncbi:nucleoside triphosphate pyrophosphohydrolase family protein [Priestia sp. FSL W8-0001]|uniref:nucleoside triphosphate pyrophosphohydrolase family protein n=2 Tax=Priestia TaxID=2800373 RepID=UPI0030F5E053
MMNTSHLVGEITEMMTKGQGEMKVFGLNQYQELASRTDNDKEPLNMRLANYGLGAAGECGELIDMIKKHVFHGHELDKDSYLKECGDLLWYLSMLAQLGGFTLEEVATANISKLSKRYKNGFSKEASIKRVDTK